MAKYYYPVIFYPTAGVKFIGVVPDLQGCLTQGDDLNQAMYWIQDAIGTWLDDPAVKEIPTPSKASEVDTSEYPNAIVNVIEFDFDKWRAAPIKELADILGAPYRTVQDWNSDKRKPPLWLQKLVVEKIQNNL